MTTELQLSKIPTLPPLIIDCKKRNNGKPRKKKLGPCEKEEICAKISAQNSQIKAQLNKRTKSGTGTVGRINTKSASYANARKIIGPKAQAKFRAQFDTQSNHRSVSKKLQRKDFLSKCRYDEWCKTGSIKSLDADHVRELQFGGPPGMSNIKFVSSRINRMFGSKGRAHNIDKHFLFGSCNCGCKKEGG